MTSSIAFWAGQAKNISLFNSKSNKYKMSIILSQLGRGHAVQVKYGLQMLNYPRPATVTIPRQAGQSLS